MNLLTTLHQRWLVSLDGVMITVSLSKFINNKATVVVYIPYYTTAENLTNNVFIDNSAAYEVIVISDCRPGLSLSLGSSHCIPCTKQWYIRNSNSCAGIALVILMLALNMIVAVGTLNGILFYANIVAANVDTYFLPFETPDFVTVLISWLNFDIGFDVCFLEKNELGLIDQVYKTLKVTQ